MVVLKWMSHLLPLNTEPNFSIFEKQNLTTCFVFLICWELLPGEIKINIQFHYEFDYLK